MKLTTSAFIALALSAFVACRPDRTKRSDNNVVEPSVYFPPITKSVEKLDLQKSSAKDHKSIFIGVKYVNEFNYENINDEEKAKLNLEEVNSKENPKTDFEFLNSNEDPRKESMGETFPPTKGISDRLPVFFDNEVKTKHEKGSFPTINDISKRLPVITDNESDSENSDDEKVFIAMREFFNNLPEEADGEDVPKTKFNPKIENSPVPVNRDVVIPLKPVDVIDIDLETVIVPKTSNQVIRFNSEPENVPEDTDSSEEPDLVIGPETPSQIYPPYGYGIPLLFPERKLTYGPISVISVPSPDISDRLPIWEVLADASEAVFGEGQKAKAALPQADEQRQAAYDAGVQFGMAMKYPFWPLQRMLKEIENVAAGQSEEKEKVVSETKSEIVEIDGENFFMQTNVMRVPSSDNSRMFVRTVSLESPVVQKDEIFQKGLKAIVSKVEYDTEINPDSAAIDEKGMMKNNDDVKHIDELHLKLIEGSKKLPKTNLDESHELHLYPNKYSEDITEKNSPSLR